MSSNTQERRSYFRINDVIGLRYAIVDSEDDFPMDDARGNMEMPLLNLLKTIDRDVNEDINTLWNENALVAHALGLLNRKISLIAAHAVQGEDSELTYEELVANISGCGMAFQCVTPIKENTQLRVAVVLKPSNIELRFTANVVGCERVSEIPASSYLLRLSIDEECTEAREQLVQHVVQRQFTNQKLPAMADNAELDKSQ